MPLPIQLSIVSGPEKKSEMQCCPLLLVVVAISLNLNTVSGQTELCRGFCDANQYSETLILKKRVRFYFVEKNWNEAFEACQDHGGNLLKIQSTAENAAVYQFLKERAWGKGAVHTGFSYPYVWLAGNDLDKEGTFRWKPFNENFDYTSWHGVADNYFRQPDNNKGEENCVELYKYDSHTIYWNDAPCWERKRYLCEFPNPELI